MKVYHLASILFVSILLLSPALAQAGEAEDAFCEAVASYFSVTPAAVASVRTTGVSTEEIPVVFQVAGLTKTSPVSVATLRARGDSWQGITKVRNLGADAFYVMIGTQFSSKTYSPLIGKYKMVKADKWNKIELSDQDVVNLVNLKFIASHCDYSMFEVMKMRDNGDSFVTICAQVEMAKAELLDEEREKRSVMQASSFGQ